MQATPEGVSRRVAAVVAEAAREAVALRGRFLVAFSGGRTPERMLRRLADEDVPWARVHVFQVDERVAPPGHPDRNLSTLRWALLDRVPLLPGAAHPMPVERLDLAGAARRYAEALRGLAGAPPALDLVHLGLGEDGHTASLFPGDAALAAAGEVAVTGVRNGRRRMTLTRPVLDGARRIVWEVVGAGKARPLARLLAGDPGIPAGRVRRERALVVADAAAMSG
ncbi:MAG: 6-phosphogluconolactonase [Anaeromyxobacteraceae bacterium]